MVNGLAVGLAFTLVIGVARLSLAQVPLSQWDGVFSAEQAARGRVLYEDRCAACHARDLQGLPHIPRSPNIRLTPLVGSQFASNWNAMMLSDIFERIRTSMPQDKIGNMTPQETADILAFILEYGGYPVGETELPATNDALSKIEFRISDRSF